MTQPELRPSYIRISPDPIADGEARRTISASETVLVDVAADGRILGIECLSGPVTSSAMFVALQALRVAS
jgi:uncharacterized protein YuzE